VRRIEPYLYIALFVGVAIDLSLFLYNLLVLDGGAEDEFLTVGYAMFFYGLYRVLKYTGETQDDSYLYKINHIWIWIMTFFTLIFIFILWLEEMGIASILWS